MPSISIGRSQDGRIRIDMDENGVPSTMLLEPIKGGGFLRSIFSVGGGVILQTVMKLDGNDIEKYIEKLCRTATSCEYKEVFLEKPCPSCGEKPLKKPYRAVPLSEIPVIPIYMCQKCGSRSYYLTKEYLSYLVEEKKELFEPLELEGYHKDKDKFMDELKEYIIRIFASKRILCIR